MNFYKITDKECELYTGINTILQRENEAKQFNSELLEKIVKYDYERGRVLRSGVFGKLVMVYGFFFTNPSEVDPKEWVEDKNTTGLYYPNKRTKRGKEIFSELQKQRQTSCFRLLDLLSVDVLGTFKRPQVWFVNDEFLLALDDKLRPDKDGLIEITRGELENKLRL